MATPFTTDYQPTPLEQAYSQYILQAILHVPDGDFRLSGRIAVPFLSSSGVDRNLLREIWNRVDPLSGGSLTETIQFTSLLKLVALAQHHWLDLAQYQGQLQHRSNVPLASFVNVIIPQHDYLLQTFGPQQQAMQLQTHPSEQLSVSDAFGDIGVADAPIPTLPVIPPEPEEDDFGDFTEVPAPPEATPGIPPQDGGMPQPGMADGMPPQPPPDEDDFGDFEEVAAPQDAIGWQDQAMGGGEPFGGMPQQQVGEQYGGMQQPPTQDPAQTQACAEQAPFEGMQQPQDQAPTTQDAFGGQEQTAFGSTVIGESFGGMQGEQYGGMHQQQQDPSQSFGEQVPFGETQQPQAMEPAQAQAQYGGMQQQQPQVQDETFGEPVPFGGIQQPQGMDTCLQDQAPAINQMGQVGGDFPTQAAPQAPALAFKEIQQPESQPSFEAPSMQGRAPVDLSSAFNTLQPAVDQPLPPLQAPPAAPADDSFGDFEDHEVADVQQAPDPNVQAPVTDSMAGAFDVMAPTENQPLPSLNAPVVAKNNHGVADAPDLMASAFSAMAPIENQPLPPLTAPADDSFGDFEDHGVAPGSGPDPMASAFDTMAPLENQPLPSLDVPVAVDDSFGDFEDHVVVSEQAPVADLMTSAFDTMPPVENQPLPSQGASSPVVADDSFGDFEDDGAVPEQNSVQNPMAGAFGAMPPAENQPLPSFEPTVTNEADDSFGDFEDHGADATVAADPVANAFDVMQPVANQPLPSLAAPTHDDFGGFQDMAAVTGQVSSVFGTLEPAQNQPLPSLQAPVADPAEDSFGDFEEHAAPAEAVADIGAREAGVEEPDAASEEDSLFAFGPSSDQPVPTPDQMPDAAAPVPRDDPFSMFDAPLQQIVPLSSFGSTTETAQPPYAATDLLSMQPVGSNEASDDEFGDFATPSGGASDNDADFGDFETPDADAAPDESTPHGPAPVEASDVGDFESVEASQPPPAPVVDDDFGDFAAHGNEIAPTAPSPADDDDDMGDFASFANAAGAPGHGASLQDSDPQQIQFGAFDTPSAPEPQPVEPPIDTDEDDFAEFAEAKQQADSDDWGDFEHVEAPKMDADFGNFESTPSSAPDEFADFASAPAPAATPVQDTFSFAPKSSFGSTTGSTSFDSTASVPETMIEIQTELQAAWSKLPRSFSQVNSMQLLKKNCKGKAKLPRSKRCLQVVSAMTPSIADSWIRMLTSIRDELTMGSFLLKEATKLAKCVLKEVKTSLATMVLGLAEFVRVERSIVASLADLLCLDYKAILSKDTFAETWSSLEWVTLALDVEALWSTLELSIKTLKLRLTSQLESLTEIRTAKGGGPDLCQLTLQPLSNTTNTKNMVEWEDKKVMACAANFWANRVSTTIP